MAQVTEPPDETPQELFVWLYGVVCDTVERAWQHWPAELTADEVPVLHTSSYARSATNRVMLALDEIRHPDTRTHREIQAAENEFFDRLWYYRAVSTQTAEGLAVAADKLREVEAKHKDLATSDPFELGMVHGKLSALRWMLGDDWDSLDT